MYFQRNRNVLKICIINPQKYKNIFEEEKKVGKKKKKINE